MIIGSRPSGLAVAAELRLCGLDTTVLEQGRATAAAWVGRYRLCAACEALGQVSRARSLPRQGGRGRRGGHHRDGDRVRVGPRRH